jgi:hypothetical protein
MGFNINGTRSILFARSLGLDFTRLAMIGRQRLDICPSDLKAILTEFGFSYDEETIDCIFNENSGYADAFLRCLGAKDVHSFDNSDYEGATHLHDMNQEIPECFRQQYSVVVDSGSLEHVFNFPGAIKNCMELVRVGGHYVGITPANNLMGHGFYQFSPELFFSVFTPRNGYELISAIVFEDTAKAKWFSVKSPASVGGRVTLTNSNPVYLLVVAKRLENVTPFRSMPQQSDYVAVWNRAGAAAEGVLGQNRNVRQRSRVWKVIMRYTPGPLKRVGRRLLGCDRRNRGFNPLYFQRFRRTDGVKSPDKVLQRRF